MFSHLIFLRKSKHLIFSLSTQKEANTWFGRLKLFGSNGKKVKKAGRQNRITLFVMGKKEEIGVFYYTPLGPSPPTPGYDLFLEKNWHVLFFTILKPFLTLFKTPTEQYGFGDDGDGERAFLLCVGGIKIRGRGTIKLSAQILSITSQSKHKHKHPSQNTKYERFRENSQNRYSNFGNAYSVDDHGQTCFLDGNHGLVPWFFWQDCCHGVWR